jgi:hypothetical protein
MSVPGHENGVHDADPGVWLTDREPGELLGTRRVVARLQEAEPIVIAEAPNRVEALQAAQQAVEAVDEAAARGEWAELGDRFVRPESIVSIDVELAE